MLKAMQPGGGASQRGGPLNLPRRDRKDERGRYRLNEGVASIGFEERDRD